MESYEIFIFDKIIPTNSTMVGIFFENLELEIPKDAMKTHQILLLSDENFQ